MTLSPLTWLLALSPVLLVLFLMMGRKWSGAKAGAAGALAAMLLAAAFFGAGPLLLAVSAGKALLLSLDVMYIIWTALLLFHVSQEAGAIKRIGLALPALTRDRALQALLVGWIFASFIQGMGGFGVPVAVAAPLLVSAGFSPLQSVLISTVGHGWAVNFGSLATSFTTLVAVTGLPPELLAPSAALLLGAACFFCGAVVALVGGGWRGLFKTLPLVLVIGGIMAVVQYLLATNQLWNLGATGAGLVGLVAGLLALRLPFYRSKENGGPALTARELLLDFSAYIILLVLAFAANLIPVIGRALDVVLIQFPFPAVATSLGFATPAEAGRAISVFGHPGAILTYASLLAFLLFRRAGYIQPGAGGRILRSVAKGATNSSLAIIAMAVMATSMSHAGMTSLLAEGLASSFSREVYPLVATLIGALGAFITGSYNNSNVLFALLQMRTADLLNLPVPLVLGIQTTGGSLGSVIAPAKVIVGSSTVGLGGKEGYVLGQVIRWGLIPLGLVALLALLLTPR